MPRKKPTSVELTGRAKEFQYIFLKSGLNQAEAARRISVSSNYVNMVLRGKAEPSKAMLQFFRSQIEGAGDLQTLRDALEKFDPVARDRVIRTLLTVVDVLALSTISGTRSVGK